MEHFDLLIIGGGAAGISAAKAAWRSGCRSILLADRQEQLGGILRQCLHAGFGAGQTGPEYIKTLLQDLPQGITLWLSATVTQVRQDRTARILGPQIGQRLVAFRQLIFAAGCREIPMGALPITGTRPAGIYTAGQIQQLMNLFGFTPQGPAVILGSGDLGLIMAGHLARAGIPVTLAEQRSRCGGMARNQGNLRLPGVRLLCGVTVTEVFGQERLEGVALSSGAYLPCKTLLIAVGLLPDTQLIRGLEEEPWLRICGNSRRIHPMIEGVIQEGTRAGTDAWEKGRERQW